MTLDDQNLFGSFLEGIGRLLRLPFKVYSAEETVRRARSRLGERKYNLVFNNCEHFALWCKTGIAKSSQVNEAVKLLSASAVISASVFCSQVEGNNHDQYKYSE
jgi:hypothetical protein